jgi:molybdate transport system substrate-binding protein
MTLCNRTFLVVLAVLALASGCGKKSSGPGGSIRVAAASDLAIAFEEIAKAFEKKTGTRAVLTFGSTGLLAKQVQEGAPFDVFAAANVSYVDQVVKAGACDGSTQELYARGRLAIWTRPGVEPPTKLADLADPRFTSLSIANPDHAPYGKAAREAMQSAGIWDTVKSRVVNGENVQQAMQYARSGNVDATVVALSLAIAEGGPHVLVDESLHAPLDQAMVVCKSGSAPDAAKQFVAFVASPEGREIMKRHGFLLPGEAPVVTTR